MKLTREQAIAEHRKMWNWIADQIEENEVRFFIADLKEQYTEKNKFKIELNCFMCEYDLQYGGMCEHCLLTDSQSNECLNGLYGKCARAETWQEQAKLARQIANLPERTDA